MRSIRVLALVCLLAIAAHAQAPPAALMPMPRLQFFDTNGKPLSGGKVCTYAAGTTTPQATYSDSSGAWMNTNPVILDAGGFGTIWLGPQTYKIVVRTAGTDSTCATGVQQWMVDNVSNAGQLLYSQAVLLAPASSALQTVAGPLAADYFTGVTNHFTSPNVRVGLLDPSTILDTLTNPPTLIATKPAAAGQAYYIPDPAAKNSAFVMSPGLPDWTAATAEALNAQITPYTNNPCNYTFKATTAGTTGNSNPSFSTLPCASSPGTVGDGTVVWTSTGVVTPTNVLDCTKAGLTCQRSALVYFEGAGCNNATAALGWDTFATNAPTPLCVTGTNTQKGVLALPSAATLIQQNTGTGAAAGTCTATNAAATAAHDLLVVEIAVDGSQTVSTVADGTNTYSKAISKTNGAYDLEIWYVNADSVSVGAGGTLTVTLSGSANCALNWKEYAGIKTTAMLDQTASNSGTGTAVTSGTTAGTSQNTELVLTAVAAHNAPGITGQTGRVLHTVVAEGTDLSVASTGLIQQAMAAQSGSFTLGSSKEWAAAVATFKVNVGSTASAQRHVALPAYFLSTTPINASVKWQTPSTPIGTGTKVTLGGALMCTGDGSTDDSAFNTATTSSPAVSATGPILTTTALNALSATGCDPSDLMHFQIQRLRYDANDTYEGFVYVSGVGLQFGITQ